ncbi:hypothetical protein C0995_006852, partial [Termitomyces sp. Mi166
MACLEESDDDEDDAMHNQEVYVLTNIVNCTLINNLSPNSISKIKRYIQTNIVYPTLIKKPSPNH